MEFVYVGKIVNTHGIKGEVRIVSDFEKKDLIFNIGSTLYVGKQKEVIEVDSYRKHKNFDMITFNKITNINDVLKYKGLNVYIDRDSLNLNKEEYLMSDLIDMDVYFNDEHIGKINDIEKNGLNVLMVIGNKLIPHNKHFIKSVSLENKKVILENVEGLL